MSYTRSSIICSLIAHCCHLFLMMQFPSMASMHGTPSNMLPPSGLMHTSSLGSPSSAWMPPSSPYTSVLPPQVPQSSSYTSVLQPQVPSYASAVSPSKIMLDLISYFSRTLHSLFFFFPSAFWCAVLFLVLNSLW